MKSDSLFLKTLERALVSRQSLSTQDIYALFPSMNQKTVSWHLHKELQRGNVQKLSHGKYALSSSVSKTCNSDERISELGRQCYEALLETGYEFYISGLDCLTGHGFSVDGSFPIIVCTTPERVKDVQLEIMRRYDLAITEDELSMLEMKNIRSRIQFVILSSSDFKLQKSHYAFKEKAFVDLYYCVTRMDYPVPVEELPHILGLIEPERYRFLQSTKDRGLSNELNFLLNYNSHFIKAFAEYI